MKYSTVTQSITILGAPGRNATIKIEQGKDEDYATGRLVADATRLAQALYRSLPIGMFLVVASLMAAQAQSIEEQLQKGKVNQP